MKIINFLSFIGVTISFQVFYNVFYLKQTGPSHYPIVVLGLFLFAFLLSYIASFIETKSTMMVLSSLLLIFLAFVVSVVFSFLVWTRKAFYPSLFGVSLAYINLVLTIILAFKWNKVR